MTKVLTLSDFLLARIAEDEDGLARTCRDLAEAVCNQGMTIMADWLTEQRSRVLAECEAKRRIVKWLADVDEWELNSSYSHWSHPETDHARRLLVLPYADHPDYREEWRP